MDGWLQLLVPALTALLGALLALAGSVTNAVISRRSAERKAELDERQRQRERHDEYVREVREVAVALITSTERFLRDCTDLLAQRHNISLSSLNPVEEGVYRIQDASQLFQLSSEASAANQLAGEVEHEAFMVWAELGILSLDPTASSTTVEKHRRELQRHLIDYKNEVRTAFASSAQSEARKQQFERDQVRYEPTVKKLMHKLEERIKASDSEGHPAPQSDSGAG